MRIYLILAIILLTFTAGCISSEIEEGNPQEYELPGLYNTTIFYLDTSSVQVVESVTNVTELKVSTGDTGDLTIYDTVAIDNSGNNVSFNVSKKVDFGKSYLLFEFESPLTGFVAYTHSGRQDFASPLTRNVTVMIVLPQDFTTGSRFLGIAHPEPYNVTIDASGREVLIWENPYPEHKNIGVKYYKESAPAILGYFFIFLFMIGMLLFGYYYRVVRKLKTKRNIMEKDVRKK